MPLDFSLTPEQEEIRALAHEFAEREIRPVAAHFDETEEFPYEIVAKAQRVGLTPSAFVPERYGGQGLDRVTELVVAEELHWGCAGIAVCIISPGLAITGIAAMGSEEQKQRRRNSTTSPMSVPESGSTTARLTASRSGPSARILCSRISRTWSRSRVPYIR